MKTILQIVSNVKRNGPASVVMDIVTNYPPEYRPIVASAGGELEMDFVNRGVKHYTIPIGRQKNPVKYLINAWKTYRTLKKIVGTEQVDLIHCHQPIPILFGKRLAAKYNLPLLTTAHNIYNPESFMERQYSTGDLVVAVSERVRQDQIKNFHVDPNRVITILNGIDVRRKVITQSRVQVRKEYGISNDAFLVCTIAGLRPQKALDVLLKAAKVTCEAHENLYFLIVGDGPERDSLLRLREELGIQEKVIFSGFRQDVYNILNASDLFCLSSDYEGLPISILEAMLCGIPSVATDVGGVSEVIEDGVSGIVCEKQCVSQLADGIEKLLMNSEDWKKMSEKALEKSHEKFGANIMAEKYCDAYESLLNG
ncbi:MAG: glycosyltransferase [Clostridia bacterium]|nr:glycosyltransferase [Clostridia bacterium]